MLKLQKVEKIRLEIELELLQYELEQIKYCAHTGLVTLSVGWRLFQPLFDKEERLREQLQLIAGGPYADDSRKTA